MIDRLGRRAGEQIEIIARCDGIVRLDDGDDVSASDYRTVIESVQAAIMVVGEQGLIHYANPSAEELFGMSHLELRNSSLGIPIAGPEQRTAIELRRDGTPITVEMHVEPCSWGDEHCAVVTFVDVSHRVHTEERLRAMKERLELATAGSADAPFDWDLETGNFHTTSMWTMLVHNDPTIDTRDPDRWLGRVHADDRASLEQALGEHLYGDEDQVRHDHRVLAPSGEYQWRSVRARAVFDGDRAVRLAGVLADVHDERSREARLRHDALHDPLTGLANRALLLDRLEHAAQRLQWEPRRRFGVLLLDLDGFKAVNDTHGHIAGDSLLKELADRMQAAVRPADTVARLGGDEFAVLVDSFVAPLAVETLARRLRAAAAEPVQIGALRVGVSASIGAVISQSKPKDLSELLQHADAAMYRAKAQGGNAIEITTI